MQDFPLFKKKYHCFLAKTHHHVSGYSTQQKPIVAEGRVVLYAAVV